MPIAKYTQTEAGIKKQLSERIRWAEGIIAAPGGVDLQAAAEDLGRWIGYFQHERLIHLIVTCLFALLTLLEIFLFLLAPSSAVVALLALSAALLLCYIAHYYALENGTQKLYACMDAFRDLERQAAACRK